MQKVAASVLLFVSGALAHTKCSAVKDMFVSAACCNSITDDIYVSRDTPAFVVHSLLSTYEPTVNAWFRFRNDNGVPTVGIRTAQDGFLRDASSVVPSDVDEHTLPTLSMPVDPSTLPVLTHQVEFLSPINKNPSSKTFGLFGNFDEAYQIQAYGGDGGGYTEGFDTPNVFQKSTSAICGPGTPLMVPLAYTQSDPWGGWRAGNRSLIDWEIELAVVIGKELKNANVSTAADAVYGFVVASDTSERGLQVNFGSQPEQGKSWPCFSTLGPYLVPQQEVYNATLVQNNKVRQHFDLRKFLVGPVQAASYISKRTTLKPGDVILMGTYNDHIGAYADEWLQAGDEIGLGIQTLGSFTQTIIPYQPASCAVTSGALLPDESLPFAPTQIYMSGGKSMYTLHDDPDGIGFTVIATSAASPFSEDVASPAVKHVSNLQVKDATSPFKEYMQRFVGSNYSTGTSLVDVEPALLIVIGAHGCNVAAADAHAMIAGYLSGAVFVERGFEYAYNTAKIIQEGYSLDTFFKMSDAIVTPQNFNFTAFDMRLKVDGSVRDQYSTNDFYHTPAAAVEYMSKMVKLQPGDVIAMLPFVAHSTSHSLLVPGNVVTVETTGFSNMSTTLQ